MNLLSKVYHLGNSLVVQWVKDPALSLAMAWVTAVTWVWFLTQELPHAVGTAKKKKKLVFGNHHNNNYAEKHQWILKSSQWKQSMVQNLTSSPNILSQNTY